ncbi:ADL156Cp [Eremothecium gossypii ATCC 10895]|uniref:ADL156Cp n=1 Tax=Eremothecium gossypii (strain ATCC 10895 / CBS 109.51 / FGSC 9923 / NRRL Y-1056) TaxID=284811 RepID=Q75AS6_EREGS|nr:ADL156Cp [Eremothecium gossypii ATCC 10895]AAS51764.2 ADL156Cp [Eremothecium gossypii ATCC 10895]AEY96061.1 FADL156Cp [Eremothecium gossypii FDAG1]
MGRWSVLGNPDHEKAGGRLPLVTDDYMRDGQTRELRMKPPVADEDGAEEVLAADEKAATEATNELDVEEEYPDGGYRAWLTVLGSFVGIFPIWGTANALGAYEGYISNHQLASSGAGEVSWIFALHMIACFVGCVFSGSYFDRNGGQKAIIVGSVLYVFGIFMMSECTKLWHFILAFSLSSGVGAGILTTPLISCVATWFNRRRAVATSLATCGGSIGGIVIPLILRRMYVTIGYKWALKVLALVFLVSLTFAAFLARERVTPRPKPFRSHRDTIRFYLSTSFNWRYFFDKRFLWCTLAFAFAENAICAIATYLSSYIITRGFPPSMPYNALTVVNAAGILGRYIPAYLADRYFGRFNVVIVMVLAAVIVNMAMLLPFGGNITVVWVFLCLYGFLTGSIFSLTPVCIGQICRTADFGKYYSTAYLLNAVVTLPVLPVGGAIIGNGSIENYNKFIIFASAMMLLGAVCYIISRTYCVGLRWYKF